MKIISAERYDADYFLRGKQTGKSLYENYRWMPDLTIPMVNAIIDHTRILKSDTILDFGCARGYIVRAFREMGYNAWGYDISEWALRNADEEVQQYLSGDLYHSFTTNDYDWIIAKDVLEHINYIALTINDLLGAARKGVFVVVPLSEWDGTEYVIPEYEKDVTHVQRLSLMSWLAMFIRPGWAVTASYRVPGVKDNWHKPGWERGNGFITARRVDS